MLNLLHRQSLNLTWNDAVNAEMTEKWEKFNSCELCAIRVLCFSFIYFHTSPRTDDFSPGETALKCIAALATAPIATSLWCCKQENGEEKVVKSHLGRKVESFGF